MMMQNLLAVSQGSDIIAGSVSVTKLSTSPVTVSVTFGATGKHFTTINGSNTVLGDWLSLPAEASNWEIRAALDSGSTPDTGTIGAWEALGATNRTWGLTQSSYGVKSSTLTFEFRPVGGGAATDSVTLNYLEAERLDIFS